MKHKLIINDDLELLSENGMTILQIVTRVANKTITHLVSKEDTAQLMDWLYEHYSRTRMIEKKVKK